MVIFILYCFEGSLLDYSTAIAYFQMKGCKVFEIKCANMSDSFVCNYVKLFIQNRLPIIPKRFQFFTKVRLKQYHNIVYSSPLRFRSYSLLILHYDNQIS